MNYKEFNRYCLKLKQKTLDQWNKLTKWWRGLGKLLCYGKHPECTKPREKHGVCEEAQTCCHQGQPALLQAASSTPRPSLQSLPSLFQLCDVFSSLSDLLIFEHEVHMPRVSREECWDTPPSLHLIPKSEQLAVGGTFLALSLLPTNTTISSVSLQAGLAGSFSTFSLWSLPTGEQSGRLPEGQSLLVPLPPLSSHWLLYKSRALVTWPVH